MSKFLLVKPNSLGSWKIGAQKGLVRYCDFDDDGAEEMTMQCGESIEELSPNHFYWKAANVTFHTYDNWAEGACEAIPIDYIKILKETVYE